MKKQKKAAKAKKAAPAKAKRKAPVARMKAKPKSGAAAARRTGPSRRTAADRAAIDARADAHSKVRRELAAGGVALQPLAPALARLAEEAQNKKVFGVSHHSPEANLIDPKRVIRKARHRTDFGDLKGLARSIDDRGGLIQPIALKPNDELIDGERRIRAWALSRFAGEPIPYYVLDIDLLVAGEWDANAHRKNFTPSEAVAIKRSVEEAIAKLAKQTAAARPTETRSAPGRKAQKGAAVGRVADKVAVATGVSRKTLAKAEAVVTAAEEDPGKFGKLRAAMDRTGKVDGPFRRLQIMQQTDARKAAPPAMPDGGPWEVCVIDFPWPNEPNMSQEEIDAAGRSLRPYPAMAIGEGVKFLREQVAPRLAKKAAIYFWTTGFHMPYAEQLLGAIGFDKSCTIATWIKDKVGRGRIFRDQGEFCIFRHRGGVHIALTDDTTVWQGPGWETRENSRKPAAFFDLVRRKHPGVRILSVFSTGGEGDDVDSFGDQVGKHAPAAASDEREEWKALGAIEAGVTIAGPIVAVLRERALIEAIDGKLALTIAGVDRLGVLESRFAEEKARARDIKLLQLLETVEANPKFDLNEEDRAAYAGPLALDALFSVFVHNITKKGVVTRKVKTRLTAKGKARLKELRALAEKYSSPAEDPQPADRADGEAATENNIPPAGDDAEPLYRTPREVVDAIVALGGHTVSMTTEWGDGSSEKGFGVATCQCGWVNRVDRTLIYSGHNVQERAVEAHWREMLQWKAFAEAKPAPPAAPADDWPEWPPELPRAEVKA